MSSQDHATGDVARGSKRESTGRAEWGKPHKSQHLPWHQLQFPAHLPKLERTSPKMALEVDISRRSVHKPSQHGAHPAQDRRCLLSPALW